MNQKDKLIHMMGHWVEHNEAHADEYRKWADIAKGEGLTDASESIFKAVTKINEANRLLEDALESAGATHEDGHEHGHGHHHHHGGCQH